MSNIKDINLAKSGHDKINWVRSYMPILNQINKEFSETKPFAGKRIAMSIHLEAKTAYLAITLAVGVVYVDHSVVERAGSLTREQPVYAGRGLLAAADQIPAVLAALAVQ